MQSTGKGTVVFPGCRGAVRTEPRWRQAALRDASDRHRDYIPLAWRNRASEKQKSDWKMARRIEKITATRLEATHKRKAEEKMETFSERPDGFYTSLSE
jgi:hypothetical protein